MKKKRILSLIMAAATGIIMTCASTATAADENPPAAGTPYTADSGAKYTLYADGTAEYKQAPTAAEGSITVLGEIEADGKNYKVTGIADEAFAWKRNITTIVLPAGLKTIGSYAFGSCTGLTRVDLPGSVNRIGASAFDECTSLESVELPQGIGLITEYMFQGCTQLSRIKIPTGATVVGAKAFSGCTNLTDVTVPESVETLQTWAFAGCKNLTKINLPRSIKRVDKACFTNGGDSLTVNFAGSPQEWWDVVVQKPTDDPSDWYGTKEASPRALVLCQMSDEQIQRDIIYDADTDSWKAVISTEFPAKGWTMQVQRTGSVQSSKQASIRSAENRESMEFTLGDAKQSKAYPMDVLTSRTDGNVVVRSSNHITLEPGWTPQHQETWVKISNTEPKPDETVEIELTPVAGTVKTQLTSIAGKGNGTFVHETSEDAQELTLTQGEKHVYRVKISGQPGQQVVPHLAGSFQNGNSKGNYSVDLPVMTIAEPPQPSPTQTASAAPKPSPTQTAEPKPSPTKTAEPKPSPTKTAEPKPSPTQTAEPKPSPTQTAEPKPSPTKTAEPKPSPTKTTEPKPSPTQTVEPKPSPTKTAEPTPSPTKTTEPESSPSDSASPKPSESASAKPSESASAKPSESASAKPSESASAKPSESASAKPSESASPKPSESASAKPSASQTASPKPSPSPSQTASPKPSPSQTATPSASSQVNLQGTTVPSPLVTPTMPPSASPSQSASASPSKPAATKEPSPSPDPSAPQLKDDSDIVLANVGGDAMLKGTMPNGADKPMNAGELKDSFDAQNGIIVEILDHDGCVVPDHVRLATGYEIVFRVASTREIVARYPVVVQGDVIGIGYMNLTQLVRHARGYIGTEPLVGCYLHAGDFDGNSKVDLTDLVREAELYMRAS